MLTHLTSDELAELYSLTLAVCYTADQRGDKAQFQEHSEALFDVRAEQARRERWGRAGKSEPPLPPYDW